MKSSSNKKDNRSNRRRLAYEGSEREFEDKFPRTSRARDVKDKFNDLRETLHSKHRKDSVIYQEDLLEISASLNPSPKVLELREDLETRLKPQVNTNKYSRSYDSVFGDDQESSWVRDFRKFQKPRLSIDIKQGPNHDTTTRHVALSTLSIHQDGLHSGKFSQPLPHHLHTHQPLQSHDDEDVYLHGELISLEAIKEPPHRNNSIESDVLVPMSTSMKVKAVSSHVLAHQSEPLPPIDQETSAKYFGATAKPLFFQTYHEISRQSSRLVHGTDDVIHSLNRDPNGTVRTLTNISSMVSIDKSVKMSCKVKSGKYKSLESLQSFGGESHCSEDDDDDYKTPWHDESIQDNFSEISLTTSSLQRSRPSRSPTVEPSKRPPLSASISLASDVSKSRSRRRNRFAATRGSSRCSGIGDEKDNGFTDDDEESYMDLKSHISSSIQDAADTVIFCSTTYNPNSPRAKFLAGCLRLGIAPRTSIMIRPGPSHILDLEHQSMGDQMGVLLAQGLNAMPNVSVLNLADNNLTDVSLKPLLDAVAANPNITELNLSENKLDDEASAALGEYLASPNCLLRCLELAHADVDDSECHKMAQNIMNNRSLEELDLSRNILGKDENLNAINPDTVTAGESLATLLREGNCNLKKLKVPWNMIRMEGARELCASLAFCNLIHIDMSFNALSNDGGIELGCALHENKMLQELLISDNGMGPSACVCICVGIRQCTSLKYVKLDGNTLGEQGARALVAIPLERIDDIVVSTKGCNMLIREEACWLNFKEPEGAHSLDMSKGYDRAAFFEMLRALCWDPVYQFGVCEYSEDGRVWEKKKIMRFLKRTEHMSQSELLTLNRLKRIQAISESAVLIEEIFDEFRGDDSAGLTKQSFTDLVKSLHFKYNSRSVNALFDIYDTNKSGYLDLEEFTDYIQSYCRYAAKQIQDIEYRPTVGESKDMLTMPTTTYIPPKKGFFHVVVENTRWRGLDRHAMTPGQADRLIACAHQSSDPTKLVVLGIEGMELYLNEAMTMYDHLITDFGNAVAGLLVILPSMASETDSRKMIDIYISDHVTLNRLLRHELGSVYRPVIGNYTGYYCLDLKKPRDRSCFAKLLERSNDNFHKRKSRNLGDISQDGDWSSFRNGLLNNQKHKIDASQYSVIPASGKLEFDFVDTIRDDYLSMHAITDKRIVDVLTHMKLLSKDRVDWAYERLRELKDATETMLRTPGKKFYETPNEKACQIGDYLRKVFYINITQRRGQYLEAMKRERKLTSSHSTKERRSSVSVKEPRKGSVSNRASVSRRGSAVSDFDEDSDSYSTTSLAVSVSSSVRKEISKSPSPKNFSKTKLALHQEIARKSPGKGSAPKEFEDDEDADIDETSTYDPQMELTKAQIIRDRLMRYRTEKFVRTIQKFTNDIHQPVSGICNNIVNFFEDLFSLSYVRCRHLALILECFSAGRLKRTDYGSYHVELIVMIFQHIKDIHNFEIIYSVLTAEDQANVLGRLGFLTLFNPVRPEGSIRLHLSNYEQRQIAKILLHLSLDEPGENWVGETYSSSADQPPMPGWELSVVWLTEEGLPKFGALTTRYYSGDGKGDGYQPHLTLRHTLLSLVLVRSDELRSEEDEDNWHVHPPATLTDCNNALKTRDHVTWTYDPYVNRSSTSMDKRGSLNSRK